MQVFPSKILLFGEYVVLLNAKALAIPFSHFFAKLSTANLVTSTVNSVVEDSNQLLHKLYQYIKKTIHQTDLAGKFNLQGFKSDIDHGLYLDSNIPLGYGIGSSGALTAALYDKYVQKSDKLSPENMIPIKKNMAYLESFFHGSSSGTDPLVSYINKPLLFHKDTIDILNHSFYLQQFCPVFLIDTGTSRKTGKFVQEFLNSCKDLHYLASIQKMISASNSCINCILEDREEAFFQNLSELSKLQFMHLQPMILPDFHDFWEQGFHSGHYLIKLCGSGGGGFLLAFVKNVNAFSDAVKHFSLSTLPYH
jgi:mevalonate kinase